MNHSSSSKSRVFFTKLSIAALLPVASSGYIAAAPGPDKVPIVSLVDASVAHRDEVLVSYTVSEHYRVYRGSDHQHPAAEMVVKTMYRKDFGKTYTIVSQSGSHLILREVLGHVLDSESLMTKPENRTRVVLTSANYDLSSNGTETVNGLDCERISIIPRTNSPYLFKGLIWVNAKDGDIVRLEGVTSKSVSVLAGATKVSREYEEIDGIPMAVHATAEANSWLLGSTSIDIDYTDYQIRLRTELSPAGDPSSTTHHQ